MSQETGRKGQKRMGPPVDSVQLPNISGWILWFIVDITIVNGGFVMVYANL